MGGLTELHFLHFLASISAIGLSFLESILPSVVKVDSETCVLSLFSETNSNSSGSGQRTFTNFLSKCFITLCLCFLISRSLYFFSTCISTQTDNGKQLLDMNKKEILFLHAFCIQNVVSGHGIKGRACFLFFGLELTNIDAAFDFFKALFEVNCFGFFLTIFIFFLLILIEFTTSISLIKL